MKRDRRQLSSLEEYEQQLQREFSYLEPDDQVDLGK